MKKLCGFALALLVTILPVSALAQTRMSSGMNRICTRTPGSSVVLRTGPGTNYPRGLLEVGSGGAAVVDYFEQRNYTIPDGEQVFILDSVQGTDEYTWYEVSTNQWTAWVRADFICPAS